MESTPNSVLSHSHYFSFINREIAELILPYLPLTSFFFRPSSQANQYVMSYTDSQKKIHHLGVPLSSSPDTTPNKFGLDPKNGLILQFADKSLLKELEKQLLVADSISKVHVSVCAYFEAVDFSFSCTDGGLFIFSDLWSVTAHDFVILLLLLISRHSVKKIDFDYNGQLPPKLRACLMKYTKATWICTRHPCLEEKNLFYEAISKDLTHLKKLEVHGNEGDAIGLLQSITKNPHLFLSHFRLCLSTGQMKTEVSVIDSKDQAALCDLFHRKSLVCFEWDAPIMPKITVELFAEISNCQTLKACHFSKMIEGTDGIEPLEKYAISCPLEYFSCGVASGGGVSLIKDQNILKAWKLD